MTSLAQHRTVVLLLAIIILGLGLRVVGVGYGLPNPGYLSSDEIDNVSKALKFSTGDLKPRHLNKPTLYNVLLFIEYAVTFVLLKLLGITASISAFERLFFVNPSVFYLLARLTSALAGALQILIVYVIGKRVADQRTGLGAAAFMAVAFSSVQFAHYAKTDILAALCVSLALLGALRILKAPTLWAYLWCGLAIGLALSTKYNAAPALLFLLLAHFFVRKESVHAHGRFALQPADARLLLGIGALIAGFLLGTPYALLHPLDFLRELRQVMILQEITGQKIILGYEHKAGIGFLALTMVREYGWLLLLLIVVSTLVLLSRRQPSFVLIFVFLFVYLLMLAVSRHLDYQYITMVTPLCCVIAAWGLFAIPWFSLRMQTLLAAVIIAWQLVRIVPYDVTLLGTDTRIQAGKWIEQNIPPTATLLIDSPFYFHYYPAIRFSNAVYRELAEEQESAGESGLYFSKALQYNEGVPQYTARFLAFNALIVNGKAPEQTVPALSELRASGITHVITSSYTYQRFFEYRGAGFDNVKAFYQGLDEQAVLMGQFAPERFRSSGPIIKIYTFISRGNS